MANLPDQIPFSSRPEEIIKMLERDNREAALVSRQLMVLYQTAGCAAVLAGGQFYSVEDWLPHSVCELIRDAVDSREMKRAEVNIGGMEREVRIIPAFGAALLLFSPVQKRFPALLMNAVRMRESAANLLSAADAISDETAAARVRREAMRLLRQASHSELLGGGARAYKTLCDLDVLVKDIAEQLRERGFDARAEAQDGLETAADVGLLSSAIYTLVSNSIRFGGERVRICLRAQRSGGEYIIRIEDDGEGIPASAVEKKLNGWRDPNSSLLDGDWGMGLPFAERVAELHGGRLHYVFGASGCTACIVIAASDDYGLESPELYAESSVEPADVELSAVLGAEEYRAQMKQKNI